MPERLLDLVGQEAVHRFFFGVGHLVGDESLDERAIAFGIHRRIEPHIAGVEGGERLDDIDRESGELRELLGVRLAAQLLAQGLGRFDDAREVGRAVQRNPHRAALAGQRGENRLADPPHGVGDELHALVGVELPGGGEQPDVALADQVDEGQAAVLILFRHGNDEAQVALHQLLERVVVAGADFLASSISSCP